MVVVDIGSDVNTGSVVNIGSDGSGGPMGPGGSVGRLGVQAWRRVRAVAAVAVVSALGLVGCSADSAAEGGAAATHTVDYGYGPVEIPTEPQRIVTLWGATEYLLTLEGTPVVGVAETSWTNAEDAFGANTAAWERYESLPKVGESTEPNAEAIAALEPDLILASMPSNWWEDVDVARLSAIAPVVNLKAPDAESVGVWKDEFAVAAELTGIPDVVSQAAEKRATYDARATEIHDASADRIDGKSFVGVSSWSDETFWTQNAGSYIANIPEDVGLVFPTQETEEYSLELLADTLSGHDVIVYSVAADGTPTPEVQALLDSELFRALPAVQEGRVIPLAYDQQLNFDSAFVTLDSLEKGLAALP